MSHVISYKNIWRVSLPIIFSGVAQNLVNITDTAFLGRVGIVELGAAGNAGIFYFVLLVIGMGFTIGCQIVIGRRNGEKDYKAIGSLLNTAFLFLVPLSLIVFLFIQFVSPLLLEQLTASEAILKASVDYLSVRAFGITFAFLNFLFIAFYTGITRTKVLTYATFIQAGVNVILDYLFIFGFYEIPAMNVKGAALASVISEVIALLYFLYYTKKEINLKTYDLRLRLKVRFDKLSKILRVAFPIMIQNFMALGSWLAFFMIIEQINETALAASHIVRSIYMVLMIPLFGFSTATSTLVSNVMGEGNKSQVLLLVKRVVLLSLLSTLIFLPLLLAFPKNILQFYTSNPILIEESLPLLYVISASMLFFSIAYILFSSVTGTGKTQVSLSIEIGSIFIYLSIAYLIGVYLELSLVWVWCSEFIYFSMMALMSILYLKFGNWKSSKL